VYLLLLQIFLPPIICKFCVATAFFSSILALVWTQALNRRFSAGFSDNFSQSLATNWDFVGDWRVTDEGWLLVTNSEPGGLTKTGAFWENYSLHFEARILAQCLGVIVRGIDLNNYYMFQIRKDRIRPHRRIKFPIENLESDKTPHDPDSPEPIQPRPIKYAVGWDIPENLAVPLDQPLSDWFAVNIKVRGEAASIQINGKPVFHAESFLKNPTGKIGFRNSGNEKALIRKVWVTLLT
jgi:Domain of Unknown Function (DUF1080)